MELLLRYDWPGNVRELQNEIQRMLVMSDGAGSLGPELVSDRILAQPNPSTDELSSGASSNAATLKDRVEALEIRLLRDSLRRHGGNKTRVADELGISRVGLRSKLERYALSQGADG